MRTTMSIAGSLSKLCVDIHFPQSTTAATSKRDNRKRTRKAQASLRNSLARRLLLLDAINLVDWLAAMRRLFLVVSFAASGGLDYAQGDVGASSRMQAMSSQQGTYNCGCIAF